MNEVRMQQCQLWKGGAAVLEMWEKRLAGGRVGRHAGQDQKLDLYFEREEGT